jgi:AraC-like DNA-binding protein
MVCNRCVAAVKQELDKAGLHYTSIELGEANVVEELSKQQLQSLNASLHHLGFELIDDRKSLLIEKIKSLLIQLVRTKEDEEMTDNLSTHLSKELHHDYSYLSNLFSQVEGTTIEKYFIAQKIERVKELLTYDELSIKEIALQLGYSSVAHLSAQFKKVTGLTPSFYKTIKENKRKNIDEV